MSRSGSVTRFAADGDLRPRRREAVRRGVVVLAHVRRVAVGAHVVPVLRGPSPVQLVVARAHVRVEAEPTLSAGRGCPAVPRRRQRLESSFGERDEVLLQWSDAERVRDCEVTRSPVRSVGVDEELAVPSIEGLSDAAGRDFRIVEAREDARVRRHRHRRAVMRPRPALAFGAMTRPARLAPHELGGRHISMRRRELRETDRAATSRRVRRRRSRRWIPQRASIAKVAVAPRAAGASVICAWRGAGAWTHQTIHTGGVVTIGLCRSRPTGRRS